ncbi:FecR domain-containing protein [Marinibaculum pumilum]|uniref:FecR domain-containing protein n=1 Tax=Marinibaculum pumilum TaxID=1766165 RepID=A0ABV7L7F5_9PROT
MCKTSLRAIATATAIAAALLACPAGPSQAGEGRSCTVDRVEGATVRYSKGPDWVALTVNELPAGAVKVSTGQDTRIEIACSDGIVVTVGYATTVDLAALTAAPRSDGNVLLDLVDGIIGIVAPERSWTSFRVRTPLAIASIRSTTWFAEHAAGADSAFFVREGEVAVTADGKAFRLSPGEGLTITPEGGPGEVKAWGPKRIDEAVARLGFAWR